MNIALVKGVVNRPAETRTTRSGETIVNADITVNREGERSEIVPVVWREAPAWASDLDEGQEVTVLGRVRKRFYQSDYGLQSRTEVIVEKGSKSQQKRSLRTFADALIQAAEELEAA